MADVSASSVFKALSIADQKIIRDVTSLLENISRKTAAFAQATGLHCKPGCGKCCANPNIETTVAEMMPMAVDLWGKGQAEAMLTVLERSAAQCAFYKPNALVPGNGQCSAYEYRPGLCRLFGFSTTKDKYDKSYLATCKVIKEQFPIDYARAQRAIAYGVQAPSMSEHAFEVFNMDPQLGKELMPINQATRLAIERVGLSLNLNQ